MKRKTPSDLVYRVSPANGGVVFASHERAAWVAQIHDALRSAKTWGQLRKALPPGEYERILESQDTDEEPLPKPRDPFSADQIPSVCDGDYPPWLQPEMDHVLPDEILRRFGQRKSTMLNGSYWHIPEEAIPGITAALKALGRDAVHTPHLHFH